MPQLVKGGKFIYGMSQVSPEGSIVIPPQAMREYGFKPGDNAIIMSGSRSSGGFGLTRRSIIEKSEIAGIIDALPDLFNNLITGPEIITYAGRVYSRTIVNRDGIINLSPTRLSQYDVSAGDMLAVGRGSYLSIAFITRGLIFEECLRHPELQVFIPPE
jgi:hypothetical protein